MDIKAEIKEGIICLMDKLKLNIGSIDMIIDPNDSYYFLEVNPVGQISGYSRRTGYNIEKYIVEKMINIDNEFNRRSKQGD